MDLSKMTGRSVRQYSIVALGLFAWVAVAGSRAVAEATVNPAAPYECRTATGPITIDGRIDEPAWAQAELIDTFYAFRPEGATNLPATRVRLLRDEDALYVAFACEDRDIWSYSMEADDALWNGDVVEFFVKPRTDATRYYEFVVAPNGTLYDGRYPSRGAGGSARFKAWSSGAVIATSLDGTDGDREDEDKGYSMEMKIPLSAFPQLENGEAPGTWTFGAFRYDYSVYAEDVMLLMSIPESKKNGFHYYEGYHVLRFPDGKPRLPDGMK